MKTVRNLVQNNAFERSAIEGTQEQQTILDSVKTGIDKVTYAENKNGNIDYALNEISDKKNEYIFQYAKGADKETRDVIATSSANGWDINEIASKNYDKKDLDKGIMFNGKLIQKDTVKYLQTMYNNDNDIFTKFNQQVASGLQDILIKSAMTDSEQGFAPGLASGFMEFIGGDIVNSGVYHGLSLDEIKYASRLGDRDELLKIAKDPFNNILESNTDTDWERNTLKQPLSTATAAITVATAGSGGGIAAMGAEVAADTALTAARKFGKGGAVDTAGDIAELSGGIDMTDYVKAQAYVETAMGAIVPFAFSGASKGIKATNAFALKKAADIKVGKYQNRLSNFESDIAGLHMTDARTLQNNTTQEMINEIVSAKKQTDLPEERVERDNIQDMNMGKVEFNIENANKAAYTNYETGISTKGMITREGSGKIKASDIREDSLNSVLVWRDISGNNNVIRGNTVANSKKKVNAFVLKEEDGFLRSDFDRLSNLHDSIKKGDVDGFSKLIGSKNTELAKQTLDTIKKNKRDKNNIINASDEIMSLYSERKITDEVFLESINQKGADNQVRKAYELSENPDAEVFENSFYSIQALKDFKNIVSSINKDKKLRNDIMTEGNNAFKVMEEANKLGQKFSSKQMLETFLKNNYTNNSKFSDFIKLGYRNGRNAEQIADEISRKGWRAFGDISTSRPEGHTNNIDAKNIQIAKSVEKSANENKIKSDIERANVSLKEAMVEANDLKKDKIFINGREYELDSEFGSPMYDMWGNELISNPTVRDVFNQEIRESQFSKILEKCEVKI